MLQTSLDYGSVGLNNISLFFDHFKPIAIEWRIINSVCRDFINNGVKLFRNRGKKISHTYFFKAFNWELQPVTVKTHGEEFIKIYVPLISKYYSDRDSEKILRGFLRAYHLTINKFVDCEHCHKRIHKKISVVNGDEYEKICFYRDEWTEYNKMRCSNPNFRYNSEKRILTRSTSFDRTEEIFVIIKNYWPNSIMNLTLRAISSESIVKLGMNFEKLPMLHPTTDFTFDVISAFPYEINLTIKNPSDYRGLAGHLYFNISDYNNLNILNVRVNPYKHNGSYVIKDNKLRANGTYYIIGYPTTQPQDQLQLLEGKIIKKTFIINSS